MILWITGTLLIWRYSVGGSKVDKSIIDYLEKSPKRDMYFRRIRNIRERENLNSLFENGADDIIYVESQDGYILYLRAKDCINKRNRRPALPFSGVFSAELVEGRKVKWKPINLNEGLVKVILPSDNRSIVRTSRGNLKYSVFVKDSEKILVTESVLKKDIYAVVRNGEIVEGLCR